MTQHLIELSLAILRTDLPELELLARTHEHDRRWRETILMSSLFVGIPRVVAACGHLARFDGIGTPTPEELLEPADLEQAGADTFGAVYGAASDDVQRALEGFHPLLGRWIRTFAYGRVLSRGGLSLGEREVIAVACLAALGLPRQLASHVRGAHRAGVEADEIQAALRRGALHAPRSLRETLHSVGTRFASDDE